MSSIILGNIFSGFASIFILLSTTKNSSKEIYFYQFLQCVFLCVSLVFFKSLSGVISYGLCAIRNLLLYKNEYNFSHCILIIVCVSVIGIYSNNNHLLGFLPIFATVQYSLCTYYLKETIPIKSAVIMNSFIWAIYSYFINNYVNMIVEIIVIIFALISIINKIKNNEKVKI